MPDPFWSWCPLLGPSRTSRLNVDANEYGDGYVHRATRGLNPVRPTWSLSFPFRSAAELDAMDSFLAEHSAPGFWWRPPEATADVFVVVDEWSASMPDKNDGEIIGFLSADFVRIFNPQPTMPPIALAARVSAPDVMPGAPIVPTSLLGRPHVEQTLQSPIDATPNIALQPTGARR
jgi:phage-related protein